jgi:hypothetical protein
VPKPQQNVAEQKPGLCTLRLWGAFLVGWRRSRLCQSTRLDDKICYSIDAFTAVQVGKNERPACTHFQCISLHYLKACTDQRSQIYLVYNEQIGTGDTGATLARYFLTGRNVDHISAGWRLGP